MQAPDYCEPIIGIRAWFLSVNDHLEQIARWGELPYYWPIDDAPPALCIAKACSLTRTERHLPVQPSSTCGYWAFKRIDWPKIGIQQIMHHLDQGQHAGYRQQAMVIGEVALWGRMIEHECGYRAEYAYPVSINHRVVADIYHVPFVRQPAWEEVYEHWKSTTADHRRAAEESRERAFTRFYTSYLTNPSAGPSGITIEEPKKRRIFNAFGL